MSETEEREKIRAWLLSVLRKTGLKATPMAKGAGLAPSTVLRALDPNETGLLDLRSIRKIVDKYAVAEPSLASSDTRPGFAEDDLAFVHAPPDDGQTFSGARLSPTQAIWDVTSRAIDLAGYLPGDQVLADSAESPRPRDVVVAQIVDRAGNAETVLRIYEPPYIVTESSDPEARAKPEFVDGARVTIWGVVVKSQRRRAP